MLIIIISGNNHRNTVFVVHTTGPRAIPPRSVSESGTGSRASESPGKKLTGVKNDLYTGLKDTAKFIHFFLIN